MDKAGRPIAPNYVEYSGIYSSTYLAGYQQVGWHVPGIVPAMEPVYRERTNRFSYRRHVPPLGANMADDLVWPQCRCGTFAIGFCAACQAPVCGDDSFRVPSERLRVCWRCNRDEVIVDLEVLESAREPDSEEVDRVKDLADLARPLHAARARQRELEAEEAAERQRREDAAPKLTCRRIGCLERGRITRLERCPNCGHPTVPMPGQ